MRKLIFLMVLFFAVSAFADVQTVGVSWTRPDFNCDGSTLSDLSGYKVLWGMTQGGPYLNEHDIDGGDILSTTIDITAPENSTVYMVSVAVDIYGNRTDDAGGCGYSNEVAVPFPHSIPMAPTGLGVVVY